jgi:predicted Zn-dependent protease
MGLGSRFGLTRVQADEQYQAALEAYRRRNFEQAMTNIQNALHLAPRNAEYHATQGLFYLESNAPFQAESAFDTALRLNPYEVLANYGKGALAYKAKDWQKANQYFSTAWAAMPNRPETAYYLALTTHQLGNTRRALDLMKQAQAAFEQQEARKPARDAARWVGEFERALR